MNARKLRKSLNVLQDGFTEGGADPELLERANLVVVAHSDGTMASYGHLRLGVRVSVGDTVNVGAFRGLSGATGFAGQPHLHFHSTWRSPKFEALIWFRSVDRVCPASPPM